MAWGKLAEICGQYLSKGKQVLIEGRIEYGSYEKDGVKHYTTDIIADNMEMLGSPGGRSQNGEPEPAFGPPQGGTSGRRYPLLSSGAGALGRLAASNFQLQGNTVLTSKRRHFREKIIRMLQEGDFTALTDLAGQETGVADILMQFLYEPDDLLYWRALEGLGLWPVPTRSRCGKLISRLLYLLNEDSGSFGWGAAAALGEIGRHRIALVQEIIPMFIGFLEEEFSQSPCSGAWAGWRRCSRNFSMKFCPRSCLSSQAPSPSCGP